MIAIPNVDKPKSCRECKYSLYSDVWLMDYCPIVEEKINNMEEIRADCPLIEIDESEMEYLYKEFGLEEDENLTARAIELKYAILMGYAYAKRGIVTCGECKWFICKGEENVGKCKYRTRPILYCLPTDFCSYGERRNDAHI